MEVLSVENLTFAYESGEPQEQQVLRHVNLTVEKGEMVLLCGPCGCGKTTLLRLLKEEIRPAGRMSGTITSHYDSAQIGYLFQNPDNQIVSRTVEEELVFGGENLGMSRDEMKRSVAELTAYLGMEDMLSMNPVKLSGGQKQMLNLASLLLMKPKVLLLDEPVSQLDPVSTWEFLNLLRKIREDLSLTILVAEHHLDAFLQDADKVVYLEWGSMEYEGNRDAFIRYLWQQDKKFSYSLPETVRMAKTYRMSEPYPLRVGELAKRLSPEQRKELLEETTKDRQEHETVLSVKSGYFRYDKRGQDVLANLTLHLQRGRIYALIGGNGSGKSTLFSVLSGYRRLYKGKCKVQGRIGLLPQNPVYAFFKDSLLEDCKMIADEERIRKLADEEPFFEEIPGWFDKNPLDLSGGQMQKAAIFKTLLSDPDVLLMDEPVKAMDGYEKYSFLQLLQELEKKGKTILFISHDLEFVQSAAWECLFLFDGKISVQEPVNKMFTNNRFYTTVLGRIRSMEEDEYASYH